MLYGAYFLSVESMPEKYRKAFYSNLATVSFMFILTTTSGRPGPEYALRRVTSSEQTHENLQCLDEHILPYSKLNVALHICAVEETML